MQDLINKDKKLEFNAIKERGAWEGIRQCGYGFRAVAKVDSGGCLLYQLEGANLIHSD